MASSAADSARLTRLSQFFGQVLSGKRGIKNAADTNLFLEAMCNEQNHQRCIEKLLGSSSALNALQSGLRFDLSNKFLSQKLPAFLLYLSNSAVKELCNGQILNKLMMIIVDPPTLWVALVGAAKSRVLEGEALLAFAWLLSELVLLPNLHQSGIMADAEYVTTSGLFLEAASHEIRTYGHKIKHVLNTRCVSVVYDQGSVAGGRHDNDFEDFRQVAIFPTADEFLSTEKPFYRRAEAIVEAKPEHRVAMHLDNQFRLLREDMLAELREDLQVATGKKKSRRPASVLARLSVIGLFCGEEKKRRPAALAVQCKHGLEPLLNRTSSERKKFLSDNRNFLKHQSFGCIIQEDNVVAFATLDRNEDALLLDPPVVMLHVLGDQASKKALLALKQRSDLRFILVDTPIFAYEHVLKCLQERVDLPLAEEMLQCVAEHPIPQQPLIPDSVIDAVNDRRDKNIKDVLGTKKDIRLDPSQLASLLQGLGHSLSLIQGPPGTGKSFIGALLAKAFHKYTQETILVICYTNHALDQFLEELLDIGIPNDHIVRLGAKSTPRTASLNLSEQKSSSTNSQAVWSMINRLNTEADELHQSMMKDFKTYDTFSARWKDVMEYLEFSEEYGSFYEALQTPGTDDRMTMVGNKGKSVGPGYLYGRWCGGYSAGVFADYIAPEHQECWKMNKAQRQTYIDRWTNDLLQERVNNISGSVQRFNSLQGQLDEAWNEKTRAILKQKRVIGCTTTAAAKYVRDLRSASAGIVLVEEAGEILESHIITALSPDTKRLALIGDHKQLRPKVKNFALTVERGDGYDLNRSLFERLALGGYPHKTTLNNQHRMCPEISSLVRHLTYPDLLDAEKTLNRPPPRGLQGRVTFFNHNQPEAEFGQIADRLDEGTKASKRNPFEADIVLKVVRYLAQQGYGTDRIVILTPYLGQLHLLRDQLSNDNDPVLNDLDSHDLLRGGLISQASAQLTKRPIRLATIDNYQGEESDIVVASLTRSNELGEIGFMIAPERLNVLLSRAREALIMIGNAETFIKSRKGKETWIPLFDKLRKDSQLYDGLPVKCEQHPQTLALLRSKEDFDTECPDGGCSQLCGAQLNCGNHDCPQHCHQLYDHSKMECRAIVESVCPRSHRLTRPCFKSKSTCRECEAEDKEKERIKQRDHRLDMQRESRQKFYMQQLQEVQDEIAHERRILRDRAEQNDQERSLKQSRQDLENLRRRPERSQNVKVTPKPPSTTVELPSTTDGGRDSACQECSEGGAPDESKRSDACELSPGEEWRNQKMYEDAHNEALDSLMEMIGLEDVKSAFLSIKSRVDTAVRQGIGLKTDRFGATLLGNPGTGKTTVARLYAKFLTSVGALPGTFFVETTGSRLANDGVAGCKKHLEDIQNNGGGVLFIDEAYQLTSGQNYGGPQVLDFLLTEVENLTGKVVFVLAGYNKQMESFFAHNPGLPSRFPNELQFKDYDDNELLEILVTKIDKKYDGRMELEAGTRGLYTRIVARRIGRGRGREGFGNARAVENAFQKISERQATRIRRERAAKTITNDMLFTKADLIGPEPSEALKNCKAWTELEKLTGLKAVKESVQALVASIEYNYTRELEEKPLVEYSLNKVFLGSPGTGKTSVAKIYGKILAHIGLLSNGEVVVKNPADFVGSVLGGSEQNTKGILASTAGKVLVIDEAYGLLGGSTEGGPQSDPYKQAVIDTIVAEVQSTPGEDRCVLLLGYKEQMEEMLQKANPGLARRFPLDSAFLFEDFTDEELGTILDMKLKQQGFATTDQGRKVALDVLRRARNRPHFGNAGEIDILLNSAKTRHQKDRAKGSKARSAATLEARHFDEDFDRGERAETNVKALFRDTVGFEEIVSQLEGYQQTTKNMKSVDMDPREQLPFNFLFRGPPGTGKTTTARKMGKVYYDMGFLATAEVIEASATELIGQYVGQTGPKAHKLLERALGKILFIDEAYRLAEGQFAKEAMDEIVDSITKPKFAQKLIIILAGYDADINRLMSMNPGLTSRFPETLTFRSLIPEECRKLLTKQLQGSKQKLATKKRNMDISVLESPDLTFLQCLLDRFDTLSSLPSWANARDVQTIAKGIFNKLIKSFNSSLQGLVVDEATILAEIDFMIIERTHRGSHAVPHPSLSGFSSKPPMAPQLLQPTKPRTTLATSTAACTSHAEGPQPQEEASATVPPTEDETRDAGVSQEIWDRLRQDKLVAEAKEKDYDRLIKEEAALQAKTAKAAADAEAAAAALKHHSARPSQPPTTPEAKREHEQARLENLEAKRRHEEERLKRENERRAYEEELARLRKIKAAEAERRRKEREAQQKLRQMGVCVAGFRWIKQAAGYRCAGGSHFVSDAQLGL